jgi:hypothetical protein
MATPNDALADEELARFFLVLKMFNDDFNTEFLESVTKTDDPTEKQLNGLEKCVAGLKMKKKLSKYDCSKHSVYYHDEVDFENPSTNELLFCSESKMSVEHDEMVIMNDDTKRFIKPEHFKKKFAVTLPTKKKLSLASIKSSL